MAAAERVAVATVVGVTEAARREVREAARAGSAVAAEAAARGEEKEAVATEAPAKEG